MTTQNTARLWTVGTRSSTAQALHALRAVAQRAIDSPDPFRTIASSIIARQAVYTLHSLEYTPEVIALSVGSEHLCEHGVRQLLASYVSDHLKSLVLALRASESTLSLSV